MKGTGRSMRRLAPRRRRTPFPPRHPFGLSLLMGLGLSGLLVAVFSSRAHAAPAFQDFAFSGELEAWPVVVPMLAATASLERVIEVFWNLVEWFLLRVGGWQPADLGQAHYTQLKSGLSLMLASVLGVAITSYTDVRLLSYLQPEANGLFDQVPVAWDVLLTGLLIGTSTKPAHDIIGMISRLKSLVGSLALKQRERAGLFAADAVARVHETQGSPMRTMAAHQPTVREQAPTPDPAGSEQTLATTRGALRNELNDRYEL